MFHHAASWLYRLGGLGVAGLLLISPVCADCQQYSAQAMTLMMTFKQSALNNQHPDPQQFKSQFGPLVTAMQRENCTTELMGMMQFVQNEQKLYPAPGSVNRH